MTFFSHVVLTCQMLKCLLAHDIGGICSECFFNICPHNQRAVTLLLTHHFAIQRLHKGRDTLLTKWIYYCLFWQRPRRTGQTVCLFLLTVTFTVVFSTYRHSKLHSWLFCQMEQHIRMRWNFTLHKQQKAFNVITRSKLTYCLVYKMYGN